MRVTSRYCEQCGIKIPLEDIRRGKFLEHQEDYYCMQCRDDVLPRIQKQQKKQRTSPTRGTSKPSSPALKKKRKIDSYTAPSDSTVFGSKIALGPPGEEMANPLKLYGLAAGGLAVLMVGLLIFFASSSGPSLKKSSSNHSGGRGSGKKVNLSDIIEKKMAALESDKLAQRNPGAKLAKLKALVEKYSSFLLSKKGKFLGDKLSEKILQTRFLAAEKMAKAYRDLGDKIDVWKNLIGQLKNNPSKGRPWQKKAESALKKLEGQFMQNAKTAYEQVVRKAQQSTEDGDFDDAQAALNRYPLAFQKTKYWTQDIARLKRDFEKMLDLQGKLSDLEMEAEQDMDNGDFEKAFQKYRRFIGNCPVKKWKQRVKKLLKQGKEKYKKYKIEKQKEDQQKLLDKQKMEELKKELSRLASALRGGNWVTVFDGKKILGCHRRGSWAVRGGYLVGQGSAGRSTLLFRYPLKHYEATFSLKIIKGYFALVVRSNDTNINYVRFGQGDPNNPQSKVYSLSTNQWVRFKIKVTETIAEVSSNGQNFRPLRLQVTVASPGMFGFFLSPHGKVLFRKIKVKAIP